jgi:DNA-binding response OmpR family regulator
MKPIELVMVVNTISDIFLFRLAESLEPYPINVRVAFDSRQAFQLLAAKHHQPDLVILDLGFRSLSLLESIDPYVPVVVFTSLPTTSDRRRVFELGAVDYIEKPTEPTEFVKVVSETVRQWAADPVHDR